MKLHLSFVLLLGALAAAAQTVPNKFHQLKQELATPNVYRTASGAPGHAYWQQKADYDISVTLNDDQQRIYGEETITYYNNSPDVLKYLWVQLDQNMRAKDSDTYKIATSTMDDRISSRTLDDFYAEFDGGFKLDYVKDAAGKPLAHTVNKTMMRVELPAPLPSGGKFSFQLKWWYNINDGVRDRSRSGYEFFPQDGNYVYSIAQFYPRMAVYNEVEGWQHKQFLGRGEFTLPFGDFKVNITVPDDHLIAATGVLQNPADVLTKAQQERLETAKTATSPVIIATEAEARANEKDKSAKTKTWTFYAENVRDFAFATSRKFIWDAMGVPFGNRTVMAMSFYPKEGNPLWERYSTKVVAHTLRTYSKYTFDYPYPVAISTHASFTGMEYPMICFNFGRPETDGTYSERTKYGMIGVVIHEVGHNFFPMIVNSDERQWTWMDEGLNSFVQYLTEQEWEPNYPSRRGPAYKITDYMKGDKNFIAPIMSNSESLFQFGNNAYAKPATALNILRETVMGRELFDYAFREYAQRWMFKHPTPEDFFRTMEDASGMDLDWFWRGWFFTTDHVDIALANVKAYRLDTQNPSVEFPLAKKALADQPEYITDRINREAGLQTMVEKDPTLADFYNSYDPFAVTPLDKAAYERYLNGFTEAERKLLQRNDYFYELTFDNIGGLVMPLIVQFRYTDGTTEVRHIPAQIWQLNNYHVTKVFMTTKPVSQIVLDPYLETADTDTYNNSLPRQIETSKFEVFKQRDNATPNPMQRAAKAGQTNDK